MAIVSKISHSFQYCKRMFKTHLLLSNTASTMCLLGIGDSLSQHIEIRLTNKWNHNLTQDSHSVVQNYDLIRTIKVASVGSLTGPFLHNWYLFLDKKYPFKNPKSIIKKMLLDQLLAAPLLNILFITAIHTLDGKHLKQIYETFKEKLLTIYAYDCMIWPLCQFINFYFIPNVYRLLYINFISVLWNALLSFLMFNDID
ncbi:mpv17 2 [Brachionus plicatilis]|uniref:Mitochondrial inner membrane protein Mpv17 n=1 Tax=Brachionus plicatilis TaxID=10195 RepID=A0A3M7SGT4_BRAPC|nr:mpv17 2 [Brachionus plicatilis]